MPKRLIYAEDAIDALWKIHQNRPLDSDRWVLAECVREIDALPSVQPEPDAEFAETVRKMFADIWDREIDHPKYQDTVGEILEDVIKLHNSVLLSTRQPDIIRCKDCKHRPTPTRANEYYGLSLDFPDYACPCQCDDGFYNWSPDDNWFCGNAERRTE